MQETRCRLCDGLVRRMRSPADCKDRSFPEESARLEYDGCNHFLRCPICSAKNIAVQRTAADGTTSVEIVRGVMDDG